MIDEILMDPNISSNIPRFDVMVGLLRCWENEDNFEYAYVSNFLPSLFTYEQFCEIMSNLRDHSAIKFVWQTNPPFKVSLSTAYCNELPLIVYLRHVHAYSGNL